ncbi:MAG TPA: Holliday junction branch migration protein RuvA [Lachnospiraceae bacterium]|nr:Holliday junction branch migration protein RuvA [Lachnospiraceae bacterium]HAK17759.1 Holliday junction branch migration protein RuvA [Lachnospiraceae bacterium]HAP73531.1 Holliday junction branch migration protein RuvA [Lachnospiraceae bacterium]
MISRLRGIIAENNGDSVVLDVNGIGFEVLVGAQTAALLSGAGSEDVTLYTYLYLREDAMVLYGFPSRDELSLFRQLITVSGIGPKGGLSLLSSLGADDLRFAILSGDAKTLSKAPGIGRKTAERLVIDLRDKMQSFPVSGTENAAEAVDTGALTEEGTAAADAVEALTALGYARLDAVKAVKQAGKDGAQDTQSLLSRSLRYLG